MSYYRTSATLHNSSAKPREIKIKHSHTFYVHLSKHSSRELPAAVWWIVIAKDIKSLCLHTTNIKLFLTTLLFSSGPVIFYPHTIIPMMY